MAEIGKNTYFMDGSDERLGEKPYIKIGKYCQIAEGVKFLDIRNHPCIRFPNYVANYPTNMLFDGEKSERMGDYQIGNDVWIGQNAVIMSGTEIGDGAIIGAHAVVKGNIPPYAVVVGNPAKVIRIRFDAETVEKLLKIKWWNWHSIEIQERKDDFLDINKFVEKYI